MATHDVDDFLEDETFNQFIAFPPEVISAIDQVNILNPFKHQLLFPKKNNDIIFFILGKTTCSLKT